MTRRTKATILLLCLLTAGACCAGRALWNMGGTAIYLHEGTVAAATVVDMEKRPFESGFEAMRHGNLPWDGETAYRPIVSCTLPVEPVPIPLPPLKVLDLDNRDYATGQVVEVILRQSDPEHIHLYRFKFLWGGDFLLLLLGLLLGAAGYLPLRRRKRKGAKASKTAAPARAERPAKDSSKPASRPTPEPKPRKQAPAPAHNEPEEEPFRLESTPPPKKKRAPRKPKDPNAPAKPRNPRKKKAE